jgi:cell division protein FtsL
MTGLEQTFYIMAIVYMGIMFLVMIVGLITVLAIKAKINAIHQQIEDKLHMISSLASIVPEVIGKAKKAFGGNK